MYIDDFIAHIPRPIEDFLHNLIRKLLLAVARISGELKRLMLFLCRFVVQVSRCRFNIGKFPGFVPVFARSSSLGLCLLGKLPDGRSSS